MHARIVDFAFACESPMSSPRCCRLTQQQQKPRGVIQMNNFATYEIAQAHMADMHRQAAEYRRYRPARANRRLQRRRATVAVPATA